MSASPTVNNTSDLAPVVESAICTVVYSHPGKAPSVRTALEDTPAMRRAAEAWLLGINPDPLMRAVKGFDAHIAKGDMAGAEIQAEIVRGEVRIASARAFVRGDITFSRRSAPRAQAMG